MLFLNNLKLATVVVSAVAMMAGFSGGKASESTAKPRVTRRPNAPVPKPIPREGLILICSSNEDKPLEIVKPDGTGSRIIKLEGHFKPWLAKLSPDGKLVLYHDMCPILVRQGTFPVLFSIRLLDLGAINDVPTILVEEAYAQNTSWSSDGKSVYCSHTDPVKPDAVQKPGQKCIFENSRYDLTTKQTTRLKLPPEQAIIAVTTDGQTFLTRTVEIGANKVDYFLTSSETLKPELLLTGSHSAALSPDGKRILFRRTVPREKQPEVVGLFTIDLVTKKETRIPLPVGIEKYTSRFFWGPDSRRLAYFWDEEIPQPADAPIPVQAPGAPPPKWTASRVSVCDLDGSNSKVIAKREYNERIMGLDWR